jgi:8-oxo-dGTP pyrophosphatase MutT (NUDIX family)
MAHIHTGEGEHDLTVSAFIVRADFEEPKILLHKHRKLGKWLQFGGHVELKENPWQALTHELLEESGYALTQLVLLQPQTRMKKITKAVLHPQPININTHDFDDTHKHIDIEYAFITDEPPQHPVGQDESELFQTFSPQELAKLTSDEIYDGTRDICDYILRVCVPEWDRIPAAEI